MKLGYRISLWPAVLAMCGLATSCTQRQIHSPDQPVTLTISAAISLKDPLQSIAQAYEQQHPGTRVACNFGGSGTLEQQIEQGAPVDIFISAAEKEMDALQDKHLLVPGTRRDLLANRLVLIVPAGSSIVRSFADLTKHSVRSMAIGEPRTVPAGAYAEEVFEHLGLLPAIQSKIVYAKDVRQVLAYVETGNADAGMVYATDARISNRVRVAATAPEDSHDPILYPVAVLSISRAPEAARTLLEALEESQSFAMFEKYGFAAAGNAKAPN
ncbi:MAG: molybdate ABC transporter substrate-binding protein [Candidatus Acidiferrales bacterium]